MIEITKMVEKMFTSKDARDDKDQTRIMYIQWKDYDGL